MSDPSLLTGWLAGQLCCQPRFQFSGCKPQSERCNEADNFQAQACLVRETSDVQKYADGYILVVC